MCSCCQRDRVTAIAEDGDKAVYYVPLHNGSVLSFEIGEDFISCPINYCPMCGRKL